MEGVLLVLMPGGIGIEIEPLELARVPVEAIGTPAVAMAIPTVVSVVVVVIGEEETAVVTTLVVAVGVDEVEVVIAMAPCFVNEPFELLTAIRLRPPLVPPRPLGVELLCSVFNSASTPKAQYRGRRGRA